DRTGTVPGIIAHVLARPDLDVFGNASMAQPVHGCRPQLRGFLGKSIFFQGLDRPIKTLLHDAPDLAGAGDTTLATLLVDQWRGFAGCGQLAETTAAAKASQRVQHAVTDRNDAFLVALADGTKPPVAFQIALKVPHARRPAGRFHQFG